MSTYPADAMPTLGYNGDPACGDPKCQLSICKGPESHGVKKPWYLTVKPTLDPAHDIPDPVLLMKIDGWVLEKASESDIDSTLFHYCTSTQWKKQLMVTEIRSGYCDDCCEIMPEEIVGAFIMHNWAMLQKYDSDMKKYGNDPYDPMTENKIEVFR